MDEKLVRIRELINNKERIDTELDQLLGVVEPAPVEPKPKPRGRPRKETQNDNDQTTLLADAKEQSNGQGATGALAVSDTPALD